MKSLLRRVLLGLFVLLLAAIAVLAWMARSRPSMEPYRALWLPPASADAPAPEFHVTFLGVTSLLFDDGQTQWMTDGYFSRPGPRQMFLGKVQPDRALIAQSLQRLGVKHLAAVVPQHSHIDHAMDAPEIARLTGGVVMGSPSTANIARGWGLPESQIRIVHSGEVVHLGRFELEFVHSVHAPTGFTGGEITQPLVPPVRATAYKEGESYSLLVRHGNRRLLLQASAGFVPGALRDQRADVVFLGVGTLGKQDDAYLDAYWRETVQAVHARRVIPVHWDDFLHPLSEPLVPGSRLFDRFDRTMDFLQRRGAQEGVDVKLAPTWQRIDPFAGL